MDHSSNEHGEHGGTPHLPDPSIWPLVAGFAAFVLGAALIFYSRDRNANFAGPLLGAAALIALIAGCGWAYEDGRMKRKAEEGDHSKGRDARFTQVVTFAIAEGQYVASRGESGIISLLEGTDNNLRDLDGFQDMRVIVSPAETGPSQVLVETTWSDREGLASYEETRTTMIDLLAQHPEEVVPGSVQVFDMEVVRDTKDTSFNFGTGALVGTFGALIVGGFMVGAGLNLFGEDNAGGGGGGEPTAAPAGDTIVARNTKFVSGTTITAPPGTEITLKFDNKDASPPHNVEIFAGSSYNGPLLTGCTAGCDDNQVHTPVKAGPYVETFTFTTPAVGEYAFNCVVHPDQMRGTLVIQDGAPVPGAAAAPAAGAETTTATP
ncbi:MAG: cupredoxin domain-containing protein [Dehalococcoidia bacterium]